MKANLFAIAIVVTGFFGGAQNARAECENATPFVKGETKHFSGPGHCEGQVGAWLNNNSNSRVVCAVSIEKRNGQLDTSTVSVQAGGRTGGESGGLWACEGTGRIRYYCAAQSNWTRDFACKMPALSF